MSEEGPDRFGTNFMILPDDGGGRFASRGSSPTEGYEAQMFSSRSSDAKGFEAELQKYNQKMKEGVSLLLPKKPQGDERASDIPAIDWSDGNNEVTKTGRKRNNDPNDPRPKPSYHQLIRKALLDHPRRKMTLNEIYQWFQKTYSYYAARPAPNAQWKNSLRHHLSVVKCFVKDGAHASCWSFKNGPGMCNGCFEALANAPPIDGTEPGDWLDNYRQAATQSTPMTWPRLQVSSDSEKPAPSKKSASTPPAPRLTPIPIAPKPVQKPLTFDDAKNMRIDTEQGVQVKSTQGTTTTIPLVVVTSNVPKPPTIIPAEASSPPIVPKGSVFVHSYLPKTDDGRGKWDRTKTAEQRLIDRVTKKQAEPGQIIGFTGKLTGKLSDKLHQLKSLEKDKDEYQVVTLLDDDDDDKLTIKEEEFNPLESDESQESSNMEVAEEAVWEAQSFNKQYGKKPRLDTASSNSSISSANGVSLLNKSLGGKPLTKTGEPDDAYLLKKSTYHMLIRSALIENGASNKLSTAAIYSWCQKRYTYYAERTSHNAAWKSGIRQHLMSSSCFKKETCDSYVSYSAANGWTFAALEKLCADCKKEVRGVETVVSPEVLGMPAEEEPDVPAEILGVPAAEASVPAEIIGVPAAASKTISTVSAQVAGTPVSKPTQIYVRQVHGVVEKPVPIAPKVTPMLTGTKGGTQQRLSPETQRKVTGRNNQHTVKQPEVINSEDLPTEVYDPMCDDASDEPPPAKVTGGYNPYANPNYDPNDPRPNISYHELLRQAISESPARRMTPGDIYNWCMTNFGYYKRRAEGTSSWRSALRHHLSMSKCFVRDDPYTEDTEKDRIANVSSARGGFWRFSNKTCDRCAEAKAMNMFEQN